MWLFPSKWIFKNEKLSSSVVLATSQVINGHVQLLATLGQSRQSRTCPLSQKSLVGLCRVMGDCDSRPLGLDFSFDQLLPCAPMACRGEGQSPVCSKCSMKGTLFSSSAPSFGQKAPLLPIAVQNHPQR